MVDWFGKEVPKLGFGLMRLPKKGPVIDVEKTKKMVDLFLESGFTYFDTAYVYLGSESAAKKALVDRHPRDSYTIASKLHAGMAPTESAAKRELSTSLRRTGAGYFDYYLLHAFMDNNYQRYDKFHLWDFVAEKKQQGLIRHAGFSFHAGPELLDKILTDHPDVDFVQLQINYADWENPKVASRANYEVARKHGKSIVVMEPVKGGSLADPPEEVKKLMKDCRPDMSYASWAIRFAASLDGIITVLSGMSNVEQMQDNLSFMKDFQPLSEAEQEVIRQAQIIMGHSSAVPCTACRYCVEGCPMKISIPAVFSAMNKQLVSGLGSEASALYEKAVLSGGKASECIACKKCEAVCPQQLPIADNMKKAAGLFE